MAATASGKDKVLRYARLYVGAYDLSGDARTVGSLDNSTEGVDMTGWSESVKNFLPEGRRVVGIRGFQALANDATAGAFTILKDSPNEYICSFGLGGGGDPAVPDPAYLVYAQQLIDTMGWDGQAAAIGADFIPSSSQYSASADNPMGFTLQQATSLSATTSGSSHDNGAATSNGAHAHLHILVSSGGTWAITIEHSSNDSSWSTLMTFSANGSAITAERQTSTGTVSRYVRAVLTRTSGSLTAFIAYARN